MRSIYQLLNTYSEDFKDLVRIYPKDININKFKSKYLK